jgi:soluble lytic murein transglycosylase
VTLASALALWPATGTADVYRFEEDGGTVHYTNVPADPRYRLFQPPPPPPAPAPQAAEAPRPAVPHWTVRFAEAIRAAVERHRVDRRLVEAVIAVESAGNPSAVSPKGAQGLMQLMPQRAAELGVRNPFDPEQNIEGGVRHLRDLLARFTGDVTLALAAYNAGEAAVRTYRGVPPYAETQDYVRKIRALYQGTGLAPGAAAAAAAGPPPAPPTPQLIYQQVTEDGAVVFTNVPPRPAPAVLGRGSGLRRF